MASKRKAVSCAACNKAPAAIFCQGNEHCRKKRGVCSIDCAQHNLIPSLVTTFCEFVCQAHVLKRRTEKFLPTIFLPENACSLCKSDCVPAATVLCDTCSARVCYKWSCSDATTSSGRISCNTCSSKMTELRKEKWRDVRTAIIGFVGVLGKYDCNRIVAVFNSVVNYPDLKIVPF